MKCPICNNNKFRKLLFIKEVARWNKKEYSLFKCFNCGIIRPDPLPYTDSSKNCIYDSEENIRFYDPKIKGIDFISQEYQDYFKHFSEYTRLVKKYNIQGRHLDLGCGAGHMIQLLSHAGLNSEGVDISEKLINSLKLKYNVSCLELNHLKNKYSLVTMSHVLEHVAEPNKFIKEINKRLFIGGFVILSVPYIKGLIPQLLRTNWYGLGHGQHLSMFSKKSLKILFEHNGFEILEFNIKILDYTYKNFPFILNKIILLFSALIEQLKLGDNLYMVAIKLKDIK